ncbi:unnamed protein product [Brassicogethes aeneus]|uniref:ZSWIM3 N-terminal domain-containing protein n=1 Tax=Brassicogethes aeneus TaxID=1431903 RepID=A0A9P0BJG1_BRAAE|nr:unnamed protein product [Brassicogethes aeneus]
MAKNNNNDELKLTIGKSFISYEELCKFMRDYGAKTKQAFWKRSSRKIEASQGIKRVIKVELIYYEITYACIRGGQKFSSKSKGLRKKKTLRFEQPCQAFLKIRASSDGTKLEIKSFSEDHLHSEAPEKAYKLLPQNRKLNCSEQEKLLSFVKVKGNKKNIQVCKRKANISLTEKRKVALSVNSSLTNLMVCASDNEFFTRVNTLKEIENLWRQGIEVCVTPIAPLSQQHGENTTKQNENELKGNATKEDNITNMSNKLVFSKINDIKKENIERDTEQATFLPDSLNQTLDNNTFNMSFVSCNPQEIDKMDTAPYCK